MNELNQTQESTFIFDQTLSIKERLKMKQQQLKSKKNSCAFESEKDLSQLQHLRKFSETQEQTRKMLEEKKASLVHKIAEMKQKIEQLGKQIKVKRSMTSQEVCFSKKKNESFQNNLSLRLEE